MKNPNNYYASVKDQIPPYRIGKGEVFLSYPTLKEAKKAASNLAEQNIGVEYIVYDSMNTPCYARTMKFSKHDPVWSASLSVEDCTRLWAAVIVNTYNEINGPICTGEYGNAKTRIREQAKAYFTSKDFEVHADFAGYSADAVRGRL